MSIVLAIAAVPAIAAFLLLVTRGNRRAVVYRPQGARCLRPGPVTAEHHAEIRRILAAARPAPSRRSQDRRRAA